MMMVYLRLQQRSSLISIALLVVVVMVGFISYNNNHNYNQNVPVVQLQRRNDEHTNIVDMDDNVEETPQLLRQSLSDKVNWHIKPIKPHHTGHVQYVTEISSDNNHLIYKRIFNAPCGYGMLVFNVGPAPVYEPYTYELYDDAYAYSNNDGLCLLFPSYNGVQESTTPMWSFNDVLELTIPLGDTPNQISTRIIIPPKTKHINTTDPNNKYHGGDYLIIRDGNFYNPMYYKNLKSLINHWPPTMSLEDISHRLTELVATL